MGFGRFFREVFQGLGFGEGGFSRLRVWGDFSGLRVWEGTGREDEEESKQCIVWESSRGREAGRRGREGKRAEREGRQRRGVCVMVVV